MAAKKAAAKSKASTSRSAPAKAARGAAKAKPASTKATKAKPAAKSAPATAAKGGASTKVTKAQGPAKSASTGSSTTKPAAKAKAASAASASVKAPSAKKAASAKAPDAAVAHAAGAKGEAKRAPKKASKKADADAALKPKAVPLLPPHRVAEERTLTIEERAALIEQRLAKTDGDFRKRYQDTLDMSWIHHDSALEGVVYTYQELSAAIDASAPVVTDSSIQPSCEEIRRHREALEFIRDAATKKKLPVTVDLVKKLYLILHPEEGDIKTVRYRKDIPQHRLYFHEYAPPDKITYKVRQVVDWLNDPETRKSRSVARVAARAHYDLLRVFPFPTDSGKVARLLMNLLLLRAGLPPAIVHSTERQRYYEALKGQPPAMTQIVQDAIENNLASVEKLLDDYESRDQQAAG